MNTNYILKQPSQYVGVAIYYVSGQGVYAKNSSDKTEAHIFTSKADADAMAESLNNESGYDFQVLPMA